MKLNNRLAKQEANSIKKMQVAGSIKVVTTLENLLIQVLIDSHLFDLLYISRCPMTGIKRGFLLQIHLEAVSSKDSNSESDIADERHLRFSARLPPDPLQHWHS